MSGEWRLGRSGGVAGACGWVWESVEAWEDGMGGGEVRVWGRRNAGLLGTERGCAPTRSPPPTHHPPPTTLPYPIPADAAHTLPSTPSIPHPPTCEQDPTLSPETSIETSFTAAEWGAKRRLSLPEARGKPGRRRRVKCAVESSQGAVRPGRDVGASRAGARLHWGNLTITVEHMQSA